jgi:hypothetical protein
MSDDILDMSQETLLNHSMLFGTVTGHTYNSIHLLYKDYITYG